MYIILVLVCGGKPIKWKKVCRLEHLYSNNKFLIDKYGLKKDDKISVRHVKVAQKRYNHKVWKGYRSKFRNIFHGTVKEFDKFCKEFYEKNVWKKKS